MTKKSITKGVIWELIGVVSLLIWTGNLTFSIAWISYRILTFPPFEKIFNVIRAKIQKPRKSMEEEIITDWIDDR